MPLPVLRGDVDRRDGRLKTLTLLVDGFSINEVLLYIWHLDSENLA
jgi:hypothetical protein